MSARSDPLDAQRDRARRAVGPQRPPARVIDGEPAGAVTVPPQSLLRLLGVATTRPEGNTSLNAIPVRGLGFELMMVKNKKTVPFKATLSAEKNLEMFGGETCAYTGAGHAREKIIAAAKTAELARARISCEVLLQFPMWAGIIARTPERQRDLESKVWSGRRGSNPRP